MNEWLKAHTYLADWIAALSGVLVVSPSILRTAEKVWALTLCYLLLATVFLALRLPGSQEADDAARSLALIILLVAVVYSSQSMPNDKARTLPS